MYMYAASKYARHNHRCHVGHIPCQKHDYEIQPTPAGHFQTTLTACSAQAARLAVAAVMADEDAKAIDPQMAGVLALSSDAAAYHK